MSEGPKKRRRWFAFSLRTMFVVVTVACVLVGWLRWNVNQVQKRKHLISWANSHGVVFYYASTIDRAPPLGKDALVGPRNQTTHRTSRVNGISWFRTAFMGDKPRDYIRIPGVWRNEPETGQIDEAFPEATILIGLDR